MAAPIERLLELTRDGDAPAPGALPRGSVAYVRSGVGSAVLDWDDGLHADLATLDDAHPDPDALRRCTHRLRRWLLELGWEDDEAALNEARMEDRGGWVTIRTDATELYALPWELLEIGNGWRLTGLPTTGLRYAWPDTCTAAPEPSPLPEGGRILACWSSGGGQVPWRAHVGAIGVACRDGAMAFDPETDVVADADGPKLLAALQRALDEGRPYRVVHLLCRRGADGLYWGRGDVIDPGWVERSLGEWAATVRLIVVCAVGEGGPSGPGVARAFHRAGFAAVIGTRTPVSRSGSVAFVETLFASLLGRSASLEAALAGARARLAATRTPLDAAALLLYARPEDGSDTRPVVRRPYRGLLPFLPEHERVFHGREPERDEVAAKLQALRAHGAPRLVIVEGASGAGKTSLVLAGLVPRLVEQGWTWRRVIPEPDPLRALDEALRRRGNARTLLVIDPLGHLFTAVTDRSVREAFVQRLWDEVRRPTGTVDAVATLRSDLKERCGELRLLPDAEACMDGLFRPENARHHVFLAHMTRGQLLRAATEPARAVGIDLGEDLAEQLVDDVVGELDALPRLQVALDALWQRRSGRALTDDAYQRLGGNAREILGAHLERVVWALERDDTLEVARQLLVRLIGVESPGGIERTLRVPYQWLRPPDVRGASSFEAALSVLVAGRLVTEEPDGTVLLAHPALVRGWPALQEWVRDEQHRMAELSRVETWAAEWDGTADALLRGDRLGYARAVRERYPGALSKIAAAHVQASTEARDARRRKVKAKLEDRTESLHRAVAWGRVLTITLGVLVVLGLLIGLLVWLG